MTDETNKPIEDQPIPPSNVTPIFKFDFEALKKSTQDMATVDRLIMERDCLVNYIETLSNTFGIATDLLVQPNVLVHQVAGLLALNYRISQNSLRAFRAAMRAEK